MSWLSVSYSYIKRKRERGVEVTVNGGIIMRAWFQAFCEGLLDRNASNTIQFFSFLFLNINVNN